MAAGSPEQLSGDVEQARNEKNENTSSPSSSTTTGPVPRIRIVIIILSLLRTIAGCSVIVAATNFRNPQGVVGGELFIPCILLSELLEFLYYIIFGRAERNIGPRKEIGLNVLIIALFAASIIILLVVGLANFDIKLWPMYIWVVGGNALESLLLFRYYKVGGQSNWTLATSKVFVTLANISFIIVGDYYYDISVEGVLIAFTCVCGVLYILHGITLYLGLIKYYSYPIEASA